MSKQIKINKEKTKNKTEKNQKSKENKCIITKDMVIGEILSKKPEAAAIMFEYGLHCIGCQISASESLEDGCLAHGISEEQIDEMVEKINKL